jgi:hypothetical protein
VHRPSALSGVRQLSTPPVKPVSIVGTSSSNVTIEEKQYLNESIRNYKQWIILCNVYLVSCVAASSAVPEFDLGSCSNTMTRGKTNILAQLFGAYLLDVTVKPP